MSKGKITIIGALALVPVLVLTTSKLLASSGDNDDAFINRMPQNYIIEPKISGEVKITREDSAIFQRYAEKAQTEDWSGLPTSEIIKKTGEFFRGTPYVAFTLEGNESERLVVNLTGLDCLTFVETTLALTNCVKENDLSLQSYERELCRIRYRHGVMDGYASRLHYLSDWIRDIRYKGIARDITREINGCEKVKMTVDYMSNHPDRYTQLKKGGIDLERIKAIEQDLTNAEHWYIPKSKINSETYKKLKSGDIICWVTDAKGLDYGHVGLAYKDDNGTVHFMHASLSIGKVLIDTRPLGDYAKNKEHFTGMTVVRAFGE